uniref:NADH-ubiquinone oxidoreductase chain 4L n=1 Tax=Trypanobia cryptica TaxID=2814713 RepID=A0A0K0YD90_9ANNE|nr:NADH dehydrogenase subunit 4L [Trypanobia cryptica]
MSEYMLFMSPMIIFCPLMSIMLTSNHLLGALLNLEASLLGMLLFLTSTLFLSSSSDAIIILVILTMGACEASIGLACVCIMTRSYGNDHVKSMDFPSC